MRRRRFMKELDSRSRLRRFGLFAPLVLVSGQLGVHRVLRLFCHGTEGFGKEVALDSDSVRCHKRFGIRNCQVHDGPCVRCRNVCASCEPMWSTRLLVASYALSCPLLPLSLLLNSLGIDLMLILMLRARHTEGHTEAKLLIWVRSLKSRDRPRLKQSTIERSSLSNSILQSCTG